MLLTPEKTLALELLEILAVELTPLTALGFMYELAEITQELRQDVRKHVIPAERLRIVFDQKIEPIGFVAAAVRETHRGRLYELEGIILHPEYQNQHFGRELLVDELKRTNSKLLGFQTQNQRMVDLGNSLAKMEVSLAMELAPKIGTLLPSLCKDQNGQEIVVHVGRYGGASLYHNFDQFVLEGKEISGLNTDKGDALVFIGTIKEGI